MRILDTKVMRGPNYWSNYRKQLIVMTLDLEELEYFPTSRLNGFYERLKNMLPSLQQHECSEGHAGGFFERVQEGTWMGHVIEHIALEIQTLAGMNCSFGRTRSVKGKPGVYYVVFSYELEEAGLYAAEAAVRLARHLVHGLPYALENDIQILERINRRNGMGPSTRAIVTEAEKRKIPYYRLGNDSLVLFGQGVKQKKIRASIASTTANIGVEAACDKEETKKILHRARIPVPKGETIRDEEDLRVFIREEGFPIVIKPVDGNHGRGITTNICTVEQALTALANAQRVSRYVIAERFLEGNDFRLLVIDYRLVAVSLRQPAMVTGNGVSTIRQLIDKVNEDPMRGEGHEKTMTRITVDAITQKILDEKQLSLSDVLPMGERLFLKDTANISTGGTSTDVTDRVHPQIVFMAERIARLMNLDICGIDIIAKDITQPLDRNNGGVLEVNACPGLRMHLAPAKGMARNVAAPIVDMLFPGGDNGRIPVVAITGTNGKTTTTRLVAHIARHCGQKVGFTTTDGVYIQDYLVEEGDCTGAQSAQIVLTDPTVDFAVLECARGGLLRSGLGFDHCNISIVTNVSEDHLGLKGIDTVEEMARVKEVIPRSTFPDGYAILNADDDLVYNMRKNLDCRIALFSTDAHNKRVLEHCARGGMAAVIDNNKLMLLNGKWHIPVCDISEVPLAFGGRASCMIKNILPALLAGIISQFKIEDVRQALLSFVPSPEMTPGRLNVFQFREFSVMLDYAHNTAGFEELAYFMRQTPARHKTGIIAAVGDRRDEDIRAIGALAAGIFDEIIIRHDADLRGRDRDELTRLLMEGIMQDGQPGQARPVKVISNEIEALQYALAHAQPGTFIVNCTENIREATAFLREAQEREEEKNRLSAQSLSA